jgi:hypothetical protein
MKIEKQFENLICDTFLVFRGRFRSFVKNLLNLFSVVTLMEYNRLDAMINLAKAFYKVSHNMSESFRRRYVDVLCDLENFPIMIVMTRLLIELESMTTTSAYASLHTKYCSMSSRVSITAVY